MAGRIGPRTIVTDAGSTKRDVIAAARAALRADELARFVPAHPLAGTEHSGAAAAFASLYRERNVVLTPVSETDPAAMAKVAASWEACGAHVRLLDPEAHDRILAAVSHLPHLLAFALVDSLAVRPEAEDIFRFAASGFRDFTRIAASSPPMWRDIVLANRDALLAEVGVFRAQLDRVAEMLVRGDGAALEGMFTRAREARIEWNSRQPPSATGLPVSPPHVP
jgi:prephenate dehydrogenase